MLHWLFYSFVCVTNTFIYWWSRMLDHSLNTLNTLIQVLTYLLLVFHSLIDSFIASFTINSFICLVYWRCLLLVYSLIQCLLYTCLPYTVFTLYIDYLLTLCDCIHVLCVFCVFFVFMYSMLSLCLHYVIVLYSFFILSFFLFIPFYSPLFLYFLFNLVYMSTKHGWGLCVGLLGYFLVWEILVNNGFLVMSDPGAFSAGVVYMSTKQ